jgi:hypothetical protein
VDGVSSIGRHLHFTFWGHKYKAEHGKLAPFVYNLYCWASGFVLNYLRCMFADRPEAAKALMAGISDAGFVAALRREVMTEAADDYADLPWVMESVGGTVDDLPAAQLKRIARQARKEVKQWRQECREREKAENKQPAGFKAPNGRGNVLGETHTGGPSGGYDQMARRRFQNPTPRKEGRKWVLYYYDDVFSDGEGRRKRLRKVLGPATMREREVKKIAVEFLRPLNQGLQSIGSATPIVEFVDGTYIPVVMEQFAMSTRERYLGIIKNYLRPQFGAVCLRDITVLNVDGYFVSLSATSLGHESLDKIRDVLSSILGAAVRYQFLIQNPVENVRLPRRKKGNQAKPYITQEQLLLLVEMLPEPYATMVYVAGYTGLRPSELIGLRWRNIHEDTITIDERYFRGDWSSPKSEASNATVPVPPEVIRRIHALKNLTEPPLISWTVNTT